MAAHQTNCIKALYLGDEVYFILDESYRDRAPVNAIVYTLAEAELLAKKPELTKRMVHQAKKIARVKVVE